MATLYEVRQNDLLELGDGNVPPIPQVRMGFPVEASKWDMFALMGRMYNLKQTTIGTALSGATADVAGIITTEPWVRFTVPTGTTAFIRHLNLSIAAAAGTLNEIALCYSETDSFTSSTGVNLTPLNWRNDNPRSSVMTSVYVGASGTVNIEAVLTRVRALYQDIVPVAFGANQTDQYLLDKWWNDLIPIIGPASVLLFLAGTTSPTGYFSLDWAEVDTVNVKAS